MFHVVTVDRWPPFARLAALCVAGTVALPATLHGAEAAAAADPHAILRTRCLSCHDGDAPAAGLDLAAIAGDDAARTSRRRWRHALDRVTTGEMPPADEPPLPEGERMALEAWIGSVLTPAPGEVPDPGPALVRRLSRDEYVRSIRDLFGVEFDAAAAAGIPDESQGHGFANRADVLGLSPALMEKYFLAADAVLDRIVAAAPPARPQAGAVAPRPAAGLAVQYRCAGAKADDNQIRATVQVVNHSPAAVPLADVTIRYWFTADGHGAFQKWCDYAAVDARNVRLDVRTLDRPVAGADACLEIGFAAGTLAPGGSTGVVQLRLAADDWSAFDQSDDHSFAPDVNEMADAPRITLHRQGRLVWGVEPAGEPVPRRAAAEPPTPDMVRAYERLFRERTGRATSDRDRASRIIRDVARRAWRRPVTQAEVRRLLAVYTKAVSQDAPFDVAVRQALDAVIVSPHFLFRIERDEPGTDGATYRRVDDHELAVRLSSFLWSSMPDDTLFALAERGRLSAPGELARQARRMLADPRAAALTDAFGGPWLQLGKLDTARPTPEFFPEFTPTLRRAMRGEVVAFFDHLRREDRSLLDLVDANYTFVNDDLARHYGLPPVSGAEMRKVSLRPADHRGGVLGMAAVLASTSHTFRTSPTLRGKYVLEVLLGDPPPPPPPDAGVLEDDPRAAPPATFRESLVRHARDAACAGCHARIDPLGFGLENYDAIGRWRDAAGLDAAGRLPGGRGFTGPDELKTLLLERKSRFLTSASAQMLAFALGRPLEECDEPALAEIAAAVERDDGRFSSLVVAVVESFPFQHRRNRATEPATESPAARDTEEPTP
jgi:hypothetical protein